MSFRQSFVIQGSFIGGRLNTLRFPQSGTAQASPHAMELPQTVSLNGGSQGRPLPEPVQRKMEAAFGTDFSDVRVHVGVEATSIGALAFAHGSNLYFAPGNYDPHTTHGQRLLGHELAHVVQQRQGRVRNPFGSGVAVVQDPGLEAEADRLGMVAASLPVQMVDHYHGVGAQPAGQGQATQAKMGRGASLAPHVARAIGTAQPRMVTPPAAQARPSGGPQAGSRHPGITLAPHVQAAIGSGPQGKAVPHAGAAAQKKPGAAAGNYKLVLGSYMHRTDGGETLPEDLAGHTFVAIEAPGGRRQAFGFSPAQYAQMNARRDLGRLSSGVQGKVHGDERAFNMPGVRTRSFEIDSSQAQAAMAKVSEYRSSNPDFSLQRRACSSFALDVARAAKVDPFPGDRIKKPRDIYHKL